MVGRDACATRCLVRRLRPERGSERDTGDPVECCSIDDRNWDAVKLRGDRPDSYTDTAAARELVSLASTR
jgi:hypothetical protein